MAELLGIIAPIKKFMSNSDEKVYVLLGGEKKEALFLSRDRVYNIPDFQREIRWTDDNVSILIEDIKTGSKFLGNIIMTKHSDSCFSIIDGQQRITILTMILNCIKQLHMNEIEIIEPCKLTIESFLKFADMLEVGFKDSAYTSEVIESDNLKQYSKYYRLWNYILNLEDIRNKQKAKKIIENMGNCSFNVILNETEDVGEGIRYFIDVNLKGKQLDIEDIFKSYLFKNDSGEEIRQQWYSLKRLTAKIEEVNMEYPLLKLLEHYFYCDLFKNDKFKGLEFGTDFLLKKEFRTKDDEIYREGTHIIETINNNHYMKTTLYQLNYIIKIMLQTVNSESVTSDFSNIFIFDSEKECIDNVELKILHNIISKILRDQKVILPKALIMKYFLLIKFGNEDINKEKIRTIYGIYLFFVLFTVFENKKSSDVLVNILKADESKWYQELIKQINEYFTLDSITDARLLSQYKLAQNEEEEDFRFRCKSLATIYNFFENKNGRVGIKKGKMSDLLTFVSDADEFSVEHFIISESKTKKMKVDDNEYLIDGKIYKRYVNNFFNFIFIPNKLNDRLQNYWLPEKMKILEKKELQCEYSKMIIKKLYRLKEEFEKRNRDNYEDNFDLFFARDFKDLYVEYTKTVLDEIINRVGGN